MCGIIGYSGPREIAPLLLEGLKRLEYRGYDSSGMALIHNENLDLIKAEDVIELIKNKPENLNLVLTGNHVKPEIIEIADLVTEMKEIKHPYQLGIKAKKGIDF